MFHRQQSSGISLSEVSFEHVVHDEHDLNFFLDYLVQHGNADTLLFWLEAEEYKKLPGRTEDMLAQARKIFDRFFLENRSITELFAENLGLLQDQKVFGGEGYDLEKDIASIQEKLRLEEPTLNMFTGTQAAAQQVLKCHFYPMFCESLSFRALCDSLRSRSSLNLDKILLNDHFVKYLDAFITSARPQGHGNLLFYLQVRNQFRRSFEEVTERGDSSPTRTGTTSPSAQLLDPAKTLQKHQSDPQPGHDKNHMTPKSQLKSPSSFANLWSESYVSPEFRERTAFMKLFPGRSRSSTSSLKKRKALLLDILHEAFNILDTFLSRGSKNDAKCVSESSRRQIAHKLEEIRFEVSSPGGKLARIGSFSSSNRSGSVISLLKEKLVNVFNCGEEDVYLWLSQTIYPSFRDSCYFVALAAKVEELKSGQHQQRNKFQSILMGLESSDDILVLQVPRVELHSDKPDLTRDLDTEDITKERMSRRRRKSYLWTQFHGPQNTTKLLAFAEVDTAVALDFRRGEARSEVEERLQAPTRSLLATLKGILFESALTRCLDIEPNSCVQSSDVAKELEQRSTHELADSATSSKVADPKEEKLLKIIPPLHAYAMPHGLHVREVPSFASENARRKATVPRRMSSGSNFVVNVPPDKSLVRKGETAESDISKAEVYKPADKLHCFVVPPEQLGTGEVGFIYGVGLVHYRLQRIRCKSSQAAAPGVDEYEEYEVVLNKHPKFGLGLNLYLDSHGFVCVSDFPLFPDGSQGAAARCKELKENDALLEINGSSIAFKTFQGVVGAIKSSPNPLKMRFARYWQTRLTPCSSCGYLQCTPLDVYLPASRVVISREPCFDNMRRTLLALPSRLPSKHQLCRAIEGVSQRLLSQPESRGLKDGPQGPVPQFPFSKVFTRLSRLNIADIIASLLLDHRVILLSDDVNLLAFTAECLKSLLWPFSWEHYYCPVLPNSQVDEFLNQFSNSVAPFLVGLSTLDMGIVEASGIHGEYGAFEDIKTWLVSEQDNLSPVDRAIQNSRLTPLLREDALIVDIDTDVLCRVGMKQPIMRAESGELEHRTASCEYSFPTALRVRLLKEWKTLMVDRQLEKWDFSAFHAILITTVYGKLLERYREYYLTFEGNQQGSGGQILAFNVQKFLSLKEDDVQRFLRRFLRTKGFAKFLLESLRTDTDVLAAVAPLL